MELISSQPFDDFPIRYFLSPRGAEGKYGVQHIFSEGLFLSVFGWDSPSYIPNERRFTIYDEKKLGISPWRYLLC